MTDFHSHTLPGIDDGSKNTEQSLNMLKKLYSMGFHKVIMTPHYYPQEQSIASFMQKRSDAYDKLNAFISKQSGAALPVLKQGAEVYLSPLLFSSSSDDIKKLIIEGSDSIILAEMEYTDELTDMTVNSLNRLIYNVGVTPLLAHIERYPFMNNERTVVKLLEMGCLCQINITSLNAFIRKHKLIKYIRKGYISAIGSDMHSPLTADEIESGLAKLSEKDKLFINHKTDSITTASRVQTFFD